LCFLTGITVWIIARYCLQENFTQQYRATIRRAIPVKKHNYPYQIEKQKYPNISHNTTTELTVEYPVNINALLRKNFLML